MESYMVTEIVRALNEGDFKRSLAFCAIFFVIWLEVRGMKNQLKLLNKNIEEKFVEGENRFLHIEERISKLEHHVVI